MPEGPGDGLLARLERYYDAVPRSGARVERHGPLTLFVKRGGGWPYYARPALGHAGELTVFLSAGSEDIARVYGRLGFERVGTACLAEPA
jgi:hypothetical protein